MCREMEQIILNQGNLSYYIKILTDYKKYNFWHLKHQKVAFLLLNWHLEHQKEVFKMPKGAFKMPPILPNTKCQKLTFKIP